MFLPAMSPLKAATNDELMIYPPNPFQFLLQFSLQFNYLLKNKLKNKLIQHR